MRKEAKREKEKVGEGGRGGKGEHDLALTLQGSFAVVQ